LKKPKTPTPCGVSWCSISTRCTKSSMQSSMS
jgi:hypothetical protein